MSPTHGQDVVFQRPVLNLIGQPRRLHPGVFQVQQNGMIKLSETDELLFFENMKYDWNHGLPTFCPRCEYHISMGSTRCSGTDRSIQTDDFGSLRRGRAK